MDDIEAKIKEFILRHRNLCYKIADWKNLKNKDFPMKDILECIYKAANGSIQKMCDIIEHLTSKRKIQGRTQVYSGNNGSIMDIIRDEDGDLKLTGDEAYNPLPLKGQHQERNKKIFRKTDGQVSKNFQKSEEKINNLGEMVRELYPDASNDFLTHAMQAIKDYATEKKLNPLKVVSGIKKGRYKLNTEHWFVIPKHMLENKKQKIILINEEDILKLNKYLEMTEHKFHTHIRTFISQLLQDPVNAQPSELLKSKGYNRSILLSELLKRGIIIKDERISDRDENGEPKKATMMIKFRCPKKNFDRKIQKLYIKLFEKNLPPRKQHIQTYGKELNEDGEGGVSDGATSASSSGQFIGKLGDVQRRKMPTEIEETTATTNVGNYIYTCPFGGDKETLARKNGIGGSVSINKV